MVASMVPDLPMEEVLAWLAIRHRSASLEVDSYLNNSSPNRSRNNIHRCGDKMRR